MAARTVSMDIFLNNLFSFAFNILVRSRICLILKKGPQAIFKSIDIWWRGRLFVIGNETRTVVSALQLRYTSSMFPWSVLLKCPVFMIISGIASRLEFTFQNIFHVYFLVDPYHLRHENKRKLFAFWNGCPKHARSKACTSYTRNPQPGWGWSLILGHHCGFCHYFQHCFTAIWVFFFYIIFKLVLHRQSYIIHQASAWSVRCVNTQGSPPARRGWSPKSANLLALFCFFVLYNIFCLLNCQSSAIITNRAGAYYPDPLNYIRAAIPIAGRGRRQKC